MNSTIESKITEHRAKFPALKNKSYLNFGGQGVMAQSTLDAVHNAFDYVQENGPFSTKMFGWLLDEILRSKTALAGFFGGEPSSYALTQNATEGCNIVLWGLDWHEGDVLLTTDCEHDGVMSAAQQLCKRKKLKLEFCKIEGLKKEADILAALEKSIESSKPRLFMISHVVWNTGKLLPIKKMVEICRSKGVKVLVDGAQSSGVIPLNVQDVGAEFYAMTCHKWIGAPEGIGTLYVDPNSINDVEPTYVGWRGGLSGKLDSSRYEVATSPFPLLSGLVEAIKVHRDFASCEDRYALILQNTKIVREQLAAIPKLTLLDPNGESSLVSFTIEGTSSASLVRNLDAKGFIVRTIPKPDCVRASLHHFSGTEAESFAIAVRDSL